MTDADKRELEKVKAAMKSSLARVTDALREEPDCGLRGWTEISTDILALVMAQVTSEPTGVLKETVRTYRRVCRELPGVKVNVDSQQLADVLKLAGL